jgi:ABC-type nitrate/sulfonate/bicarbonate transport system substrate-binding protein
MTRFIVQPHFRLQEWVAEEKGYFKDEGLDYIFRETVRSSDGKIHDKGDKQGAFQSLEAGRKADVSCACHWTVNMAASAGHGKLWRDCYTVCPSAVFVAGDSPVRRPEDLAGVEVVVGYHSGSHYSAIQALERVLKAEDIKLHFGGPPPTRLADLVDGKVAAANLFGAPYYIAEQLGFRKVLDTTFMMASMVNERAANADVVKYYNALRKAQRDIDLTPEAFTHYFEREMPERFRGLVDTRLFGPGERLVYEPYSQEVFDTTHKWVEDRGLFDASHNATGGYAESTVAAA